MTTPLFTFVTVRNPRRPTAAEVISGFVHYDPSLGQGGELTARVAEARAADQPVQELIREFRADGSHVALVTDLEQRSAEGADWADWLAEHVEHLTWAEVDERLPGHPLDLDAATYQMLWDNLIAYTYGGGPPETREAIIWTIRAVNLVRYPAEQRGDDTNARRVAGATVLIPAESHYPLFRELLAPAEVEAIPEEEAAPVEDAAEQAVSAGERLTRLAAAHAELYECYLSVLDLARSEPTPAPVVARVDYDRTLSAPGADEAPHAHEAFRRLDEATYDRLTDSTREVLGELGVDPGMRAVYALRRLEGALGRASSTAALGARATEQVVAVGGAFFSTTTAPVTHDHPPEVVRRADVEYFGFFGPSLGHSRRGRRPRELCC